MYQSLEDMNRGYYVSQQEMIDLLKEEILILQKRYELLQQQSKELEEIKKQQDDILDTLNTSIAQMKIFIAEYGG